MQRLITAMGAAQNCLVEEFKKAPRGKLFVELKSVLDPDHRFTSKSLKEKWQVVSSLAEASEVCREFIEKNELGSGSWDGGKVVNDEGVQVAQISYNGRAWKPGKYPTPEINIKDWDSKNK